MKGKCYIFSYNRGIFLENCLKSAEKLATDFFDIAIVDDGSTDKKTQEVLEKCSTKYEVFYPPKRFYSYKVGGLYNNMNFALENAKKEKREFMLFLQDDMQVVRKINEEDMKRVKRFFKNNTQSVQLYTCFFKERGWRKNTFLDQSKTAYFNLVNDFGINKFFYFADPGLFYVPRFIELFGEFQKSEQKNEEIARTRGAPMGMYAFPFMMWLPMPLCYRGQKRSTALLFTHRTLAFYRS